MKKEPNQSVARLRKIIGKTQDQFAVMLGVSKDTIVSVENGRNRLSPGLAARIHVATGATQASLLGNKEVLMAAGQQESEYTRQSFDQWQAKVFVPDANDPAGRKNAAQFFFDTIKGRLEVLLIAAARPGRKGKDRFPSVISSLENWIQQAYEDFELAEEVDQVLREETMGEVTDHLSVGFLREAKKTGNPIAFNFKDSKQYKDDDCIDVSHYHYDDWNAPYIVPPERGNAKRKPVPPSEGITNWKFEHLFESPAIEAPPKPHAAEASPRRKKKTQLSARE